MYYPATMPSLDLMAFTPSLFPSREYIGSNALAFALKIMFRLRPPTIIIGNKHTHSLLPYLFFRLSCHNSYLLSCL